MRSWADERIAAQTEQMELQSEEAKVVAARSKEETKVEVAQLMEVWRTLFFFGVGGGGCVSGTGESCVGISVVEFAELCAWGVLRSRKREAW